MIKTQIKGSAADVNGGSFKEGEFVYVLSEEEYRSIEESAALLSSKENRNHLEAALSSERIRFDSVKGLKDALKLQ